MRIWSNGAADLFPPTDHRVTKSCRPSALRRTIGVKEGWTPESSSTLKRTGQWMEPRLAGHGGHPRDRDQQGRRRPGARTDATRRAAALSCGSTHQSSLTPRRTPPPFASGRPEASPARARLRHRGGAGPSCGGKPAAGAHPTGPGKDRLSSETGERRLTGEHFVQHYAEGVSVGPRSRFCSPAACSGLM